MTIKIRSKKCIKRIPPPFLQFHHWFMCWILAGRYSLTTRCPDPALCCPCHDNNRYCIKKIMKGLLIGIVAALSFISLQGQQVSGSKLEAYYCPPCNNRCDQLSFGKPGSCQHCGMLLVKQTAEQRKESMTGKKMSIGFYLQDGVEVSGFCWTYGSIFLFRI